MADAKHSGNSRRQTLRQHDAARVATKARSVTMLFLSDGPLHLDMRDLKPESPEEIRGTFQPIPTLLLS